MPTAKCIKCGERYHGWSLVHQPGQKCNLCGGHLIMLPDICENNRNPVPKIAKLLSDNGYVVIEGADAVLDAIEQKRRESINPVFREHDYLDN